MTNRTKTFGYMLCISLAACNSSIESKNTATETRENYKLPEQPLDRALTCQAAKAILNPLGANAVKDPASMINSAQYLMIARVRDGVQQNPSDAAVRRYGNELKSLSKTSLLEIEKQCNAVYPETVKPLDIPSDRFARQAQCFFVNDFIGKAFAEEGPEMQVASKESAARAETIFEMWSIDPSLQNVETSDLKRRIQTEGLKGFLAGPLFSFSEECELN